MRIQNHIPNFITSLNLLSGSISILFSLGGRHDIAALLIFSAAIFDFFDGFAARALKAYSPMGKELDSLADMVSFGVAPAVMLVYMMMRLTIFSDKLWGIEYISKDILMLIIAPLLLVVFSGLRLAKFNIDTRQSETFLGLTTTATGMFIASFGYMVFKRDEFFLMFYNAPAILTMVVVFSALLVSEIPMFSLKFKTFGLQGNLKRYGLILFALVSLVVFNIGGIALTIAGYVVVSIFSLLFKKLTA